MILSDVCLSVTYIGPKSRTEKPRKTKIGTEIGHVTRDSDTIFKVKGQGHRGGAYCGGLPHGLLKEQPWLGDLLLSKRGLMCVRVHTYESGVGRASGQNNAPVHPNRPMYRWGRVLAFITRL